MGIPLTGQRPEHSHFWPSRRISSGAALIIKLFIGAHYLLQKKLIVPSAWASERWMWRWVICIYLLYRMMTFATFSNSSVQASIHSSWKKKSLNSHFYNLCLVISQFKVCGKSKWKMYIFSPSAHCYYLGEQLISES